MAKTHLEELEELYGRVDRALPSSGGNPCGSCRECCTALPGSRHAVGSLELELLAQKTSPEQADRFRRYAARESDADGSGCPFYDTTTARCGVYSYRPFSCRIFGHFQVQGTELPAPCVFKGQTTVLEQKDYYPIVPQSRELRDLTRRHAVLAELGVKYQDARAAERLPTSEELEFLDPDDLLDRAILHQSQGDVDQALQDLREARVRYGDQPHVLNALGLMLESTRRYEEARDVFLQLVEALPTVSSVHLHAGYNAFVADDEPEAFRLLERAVQLNPQCSMALGLMSYIKLTAGDPEAAARLLEQAVEVEPENGYFHLRLGVARLAMGRLADGLDSILRAAEFEPTRPKALELLGKH